MLKNRNIFLLLVLVVGLAGCATNNFDSAYQGESKLLVALNWQDSTGRKQDYVYRLYFETEQGEKISSYLRPKGRFEKYLSIDNLPAGKLELTHWQAIQLSSAVGRQLMTTTKQPIYLELVLNEKETKVLSYQLTIRRYEDKDALQTEAKFEPIAAEVLESAEKAFNSSDVDENWRLSDDNSLVGEQYLDPASIKRGFTIQF
jgi:hypothetical protein